MKAFPNLPAITVFCLAIPFGCQKPPAADFSVTPTSVMIGDTVQFTDESLNEPTQWLWDFGDGAGSSEQHPGHVYETGGIYTVTLTATNKAASDEITKEDLVEVNRLVDIDGNIYKTVEIGSRIWMAENLATTTFNDSSGIPNVTGNSEWFELSSPSYCWYENDIVLYKEEGALYNWFAVETGKLCPEGWHVPSDAEWMELEIFIGLSENEALSSGDRGTDEGYKLKTGTGWYNEGNGSDEYGFSAFPSGVRTNYYSPEFYAREIAFAAWTSSSTTFQANIRQIHWGNQMIGRYIVNKTEGLAVRCVKD